REANPAPFGAFMNFGSIKLASASPERFINHYGRIAETRPIKGTIKRYADPEHDQDQKDMLASSDKDRAENVMIVDLLRTDLSKVCEDHSVRVTRLNHLESFAHVHHLVSTVEGVIRADKSAVSLLEACFPGGSITGAPKVRAMEIIEELEDTRRGPYCGSMGYIGFDGTMDTNIIIRTLVYNGNTVSLNVGGGITAASDPASEYMETLHKALGFFGGDITIEKEDSDSKKRA
ncbi:MAG: anthranilate synthase component I family protein, partial [Pseudomonadota bacterium]|nr:anthranilate synthase component I family protein [Pseudomonadota bacterium]